MSTIGPNSIIEHDIVKAKTLVPYRHTRKYFAETLQKN